MTKFLVLILVSLVPPLWSAPPPPIHVQGKIISFRGFEDDAGGFYLVWAEDKVGRGTSLYAQHLSSGGQPAWGSPSGILAAEHLLSPKDWSGLADGRGGLLLFWDEPDGIHFQRFGPDGLKKTPKALHLSSMTVSQPDATNDAQGGTLVVWGEKHPSGRSVLKAQRLSVKGDPVWASGGLRISLRASHQTNPRVIFDNMSGLIIAWRDEVNQASEMRVQRIDFEGNLLWGLEGVKVFAPVGTSEFPMMVPLGTGEAVLTWTAPQRQVMQTFLQKVGPKGVLQWENGKLASGPPNASNQWNPVLAGDAEGGTWIAWEDYRDEKHYQAQLHHLKGDGTPAWGGGEIAIAPAAGDQGKIALALDQDRSVWAAWVDNRRATVGLYAQKIDQKGHRIFGPKGRLLVDRLSKPSRPQVIPLAPGQAAVVWADGPKKDRWTLHWTRL